MSINETDAGHSSADVAIPRFLPVRYWAVAGAVITAFMAYVLIHWIAGPQAYR